MQTEQHHIRQYLEKGDKESLGMLFRQYRNYLFRVAFVYTKSEFEADDLLQNVLLNLLERPPVDKDQASFSFKNYAATSIRNYYFDMRRRAKKIRYVELAEAGVQVEGPDPYNEADFSKLHEVIATLPANQKKVIKKRLKNILFAEIASKMNISINTAIGINRYALTNLRKKESDLSEYKESLFN